MVAEGEGEGEEGEGAHASTRCVCLCALTIVLCLEFHSVCMYIYTRVLTRQSFKYAYRSIVNSFISPTCIIIIISYISKSDFWGHDKVLK